MSGRIMDVENHQLLLTSSPSYNGFLETTEDYTLQIQRKSEVLFVYRVPESPSPTSQSSRPRPTFSHSQLTALHVVRTFHRFKRYVFILLTKMRTETKTVPST